jgi:glucose/arabinose dehydrogenase
VRRGANYGYPLVSEGDHYSGASIPDHRTRPDLEAPKVSWNPVISPSSLLFYAAGDFPEWDGNALIGGLSSSSIVRVEIAADGSAREAARYRMPRRVRGLVQAADGTLFALEDGRGGRLLELTPAR